MIGFIITSSCTDQGCIDADDFGEYEQQTVEVTANAGQDNCTYDPSQTITDASQGSGIKTCLTQGSVSITDETNTTENNGTANNGCIGLTDAKFQNLCISNCVQLCMTNASSNSSSAEPNWTSTDAKVDGENIGVTISPSSQIIINATGSVILGDQVDYPDMFVLANNAYPHSRQPGNNSQDIFFDARSGQTIALKFSGQWTDGVPDTIYETSTSETVGGGATKLNSTAADSKIYNGARRLVAYSVPHPDGYDFDASKTSEKAGAKGVPLLPDAGAWQCTYDSSDTTQTQSSCKSVSYVAIGYSNVTDSAANTAFPVSSAAQSSILTTYGGFIRWAGDGLNSDSYDPFITVSCDTTGACSGTDSMPQNSGQVVNLSYGARVQNSNSSTAYKASLKSLISGCSITATIAVIDSNSKELYSFNNVSINNNWTSASSATGGNFYVALEPGQTIQITPNGSSYCTTAVAIRFTKFQDIKIDRSGFVKFTMLRGSGNCTIQGRVINPNGSQTDLDSSYTADFYENDTFGIATSKDPLSSLSVPATPTSVSPDNYWSNPVFVRKGQIIRFAPESWNGTWVTDSGGLRQCGIGMAMIITPRPALLCRGKAADVVDNPSCVPDYNSSGTLIGCQAFSQDCSNPTSTSYCPVSCQQTITCTAGTAANNYQKTSCASGSGSANYSPPSGCTFPDSSYSSGTCSSCFNSMITAATSATKLPISGIDQCYDLENYSGKVANIPYSGTPSSSTITTFLQDAGLVKLGAFNGSYGNFTGFSDSGTTNANGNIVYQSKVPLTFTREGRLRFFMLDGADFKIDPATGGSTTVTGMDAIYSNNSGGFGINISGNLNFNNGQWLQARLCLENSDSSYLCKGANVSAVAGQPSIIEIATPSSSDPVGSQPNLTGNYKFDGYGNITRITAPGTGDCTIAANGLDTVVGALYYCHTDVNDASQNLRISFKILDPEVGNCDLPGSTSGSNNGIKQPNPFYLSSDSSNTGAMCNAGSVPGDGSTQSHGTCRSQFYCANKYSNNSGKYYVNVKVKNLVDGTASSIVGSVINPIVEVMDGTQDDPDTPDNEATVGQAERVYNLLITDERYKAILNICIVAMFTFYGFGYLLGVSELNHAEIINRVIKIGLIYLFVGETGWYWFNQIIVKFFKNGTDYLAFMMASSFDDSPELSNAIATGNYYDKSILFSSADKVFSMFFSSAVQKKASALLFASIFGWAYWLILYYGFMLYVYSVANAVLLYLTAQVFISILFVLGPIFFVFTLFSQTKEMFDNWLKQLIGFSLQQIFLLTTLAFFNMLMYEVIKMSLGFKVCWDDVWTINIVITRITLLSFWTIASLPPRTNAQSQVGNIGNPEGIPSLFSILFIWVIASLMEKFIGFMTDLAASISGGLKASELGSGIAEAAKGFNNYLSSNASALWEKTGGAAIERLDQVLFDSGKFAKDERQQRKTQAANDLKNKGALGEAGDKAVSDYKINNASELAGMSKEEQRKKLTEVRSEAMIKKGEKLGLSASQVQGLLSQKGLNYEGTNIFGATLQAMKQGVSRGGTLTGSIDDEKVNTKLSHDESQQALGKMDAEQRKKFIDEAKQGKISIGKSNFDKFFSGGWKKVARIGGGVITGGISEGVMAAVKGIQKNSEYNSEYDKATKQLEDQGLVTRMANGTNWTRKDAEKKLIREQVKKNTEQKKTNLKKADKHAIAELERESEYLEADEKADEKIDQEDQSTGIKDKIKNRWEKFTSYWQRINPGQRGKYREDASKTTREKNQQRVSEDLGKAKEELSILEEGRERAMESFNEADKNLNESAEVKELNKIKERANDSGGFSKEDLRRSQEIQSSATYRNLLEERNKAAIGTNQLDAKIDNAKEKTEQLESYLGNITESEKIMSMDKITSAQNKSDIEDRYNHLSTAEDFKEFVSDFQNDKLIKK